MKRDLNTITLSGRLAKDCFFKEGKNGGETSLACFTLANNHTGKGKDTLFFKCFLWGKAAEAWRSQLTKGTSIILNGICQGTEQYKSRQGETKSICKIKAIDITLANDLAHGVDQFIATENLGSLEGVFA